MKVFIFGIDALDYELVKKWNMNEFKQKEFGKVIIPKEIELLSTPTLWATIITGQLPKVHGVQPGWYVGEYKYPLASKLRLLVKKLNMDKQAHKTLMSSKFLNNMVTKLIQQNRVKQEFKLKCPTFFDNVKSFHVGVPTYDKLPEIAYDIVKKQFEVFEGNMTRIEWEKLVRTRFENTKKTLFENLDKKWDLSMVYFAAIDHIGHVYYDDEEHVKRYYEEVAEIVKKVKKKLDKDTLVLMVSDHGMKRGIHTRYAFYSSNKKLGLKKPRLTDFYDIVTGRVTNNA
jgi:predicted AlkP superfamily pyrophosphatase or phosphodiesterase